MPNVQIGGVRELQQRADALRRATNELKPALRRRMRDAAEPMKTSAQASALAIPTHGDKHTGLRAQIARATTVTTRITQNEVGVRVGVVNKRRMPAGKQRLPGLMEGGGWQHPVYGHSWKVFQRGRPWFARAVAPLVPGVHQAVVNAVNDATRPVR